MSSSNFNQSQNADAQQPHVLHTPVETVILFAEGDEMQITITYPIATPVNPPPPLRIYNGLAYLLENSELQIDNEAQLATRVSLYLRVEGEKAEPFLSNKENLPP